MKLIQSMRSAFAMYSRIPTGKIEWTEENRRYALCFFPLIGIVIGCVLILWQHLADRLQIGTILYAAIAMCIPVWITGGIHMDGFYDVTDAVSSCQPKEKKLAIMSDPHIGAFAGMKGSLYFMIMFALFTEVHSVKAAALIGMGYVLSRTLSALAAVSFKAAKKEGTLQDFVRPAQRSITAAVLMFILTAVSLIMMKVHLIGGISVLCVSFFIFCYYKRMAYKYFGGITGDLAGYFLQLCEMGILAAVVISFKVLEVMTRCS